MNKVINVNDYHQNLITKSFIYQNLIVKCVYQYYKVDNPTD